MVLPMNNIQWDEECDERGIGGKPHINVNLDANEVGSASFADAKEHGLWLRVYD